MENNRERTFCAGEFRLIVSKGEVIRCYKGWRKILPESSNFFASVEDAMKELMYKAPDKFIELYKSLYLSSREYKIAKRMYGPLFKTKKG